MRITRLEAWPIEMQLAEAYTIAYEGIDSTTNVFIRIETDKGLVGYGCAAPDAQVTGETPEKVLKIYRDVIEPALQRENPLRLAKLSERLQQILPASPSAMAMVDMALHDILGKFAGLPIYLLLGGFRKRMKTSVTIGILSSAEAVVKAKEFVANRDKPNANHYKLVLNTLECQGCSQKVYWLRGYNSTVRRGWEAITELNLKIGKDYKTIKT